MSRVFRAHYPTTLKSRLRVIQGHWKRNHWIDYTRLTISRVIWRWLAYYRDLEMWFRSHSRSLKVVPFWKLGYGFLFAFHSNYGRIFIHFGDIQRQRMAWPWNLGLGSVRSLRMAPFDRPCMTLLVIHYNYSSILYRLRVICRWILSWPWSVG